MTGAAPLMAKVGRTEAWPLTVPGRREESKLVVEPKANVMVNFLVAGVERKEGVVRGGRGDIAGIP